MAQLTQQHRFRLLTAQSRSLGERNDCTVVALAAVTGYPYGAVHRALERRGRLDRRGCPYTVWLPALIDLGWTYADAMPLTGGRVKTVITAKQWLERNAPRETRFLVHQTRHVAAYVDGTLLDWASMTHRRTRVEALYLVQPGYDWARTVC